MFSCKLTLWNSTKEDTQMKIDSHFKSNFLLESQAHKNAFSGFLIDFEFLYLKKNFSLKIKQKIKPQQQTFFGNLLGKSKTKVKTKDMKGMVSSTIFTLNQSSTQSVLSFESKEENRSRVTSMMNPIEKVSLPIEERDPFLLDFIVHYSKV